MYRYKERNSATCRHHVINQLYSCCLQPRWMQLVEHPVKMFRSNANSILCYAHFLNWSPQWQSHLFVMNEPQSKKTFDNESLVLNPWSPGCTLISMHHSSSGTYRRVSPPCILSAVKVTLVAMVKAPHVAFILLTVSPSEFSIHQRALNKQSFAWWMHLCEPNY